MANQPSRATGSCGFPSPRASGLPGCIPGVCHSHDRVRLPGIARSFLLRQGRTIIPSDRCHIVAARGTSADTRGGRRPLGTTSLLTVLVLLAFVTEVARAVPL